ncbi:MAG: urate hydroxylase PuuD [Deltaproteobacteria bacterium]|jgi:uncharacterized membrane protein|nr:urate hydroxylase PuuD [Deltaproteobacteria bacterium]
MSLDINNLVESLFRWLHIVAGVVWIGHLYFFNWVNANFAPTMDGETKKKVVPELMPRALYFFRWGAAYTWLTGIGLAGLVYYMNETMLFEDGMAWNPVGIVIVVLTYFGFFLYDVVMKAVKNVKLHGVIGWVLAAGYVMLAKNVGGMSYRGAAIHLGMTFGTIMAMNVWMRIWPAQKKIIAAVKEGTAPDAALVAMAGLRSKHNTYMSAPLLFMMMSQHGTWASSMNSIPLTVVIALGFLLVMWLYTKSKADAVKSL